MASASLITLSTHGDSGESSDAALTGHGGRGPDASFNSLSLSFFTRPIILLSSLHAGEKIDSYTIITTDSNKQLKWLHDRMPAILPDDNAVNVCASLMMRATWAYCIPISSHGTLTA